jgi:hypothetical protein
MAEWLSTDLFQSGVPPPRRTGEHANADFGPIKAALGDRAKNVEESAKKEQRGKNRAEKEFRRKQFTHEIELEHKADGQY